MKSYYYNLDQKPIGNEINFGAEQFLIIRILGDGNCFFRSISEISNLDDDIRTITHLQLREEVQKELRSNQLLKNKVREEVDDKFDQKVEDREIEEYIDNIGHNAEYAGSPECYAASKILKAKVLIYRSDQPLEHAITSYDYRELTIQDTTPVIPTLRLIYQPYNGLPEGSPNHYNILVDPALKTIFEEGDYSAKQGVTSSHVIDKISQKRRRDAAFLSDTEKLINTCKLIEELLLMDSDNEDHLSEIFDLLKQVGLLLKTIYYEEDDKDNFRNKYTPHLALDLFDKLEFIEEAKGRIKLLVKHSFNSDIKNVLSNLKQNIEISLYSKKNELIISLSNQIDKQSLIDDLNKIVDHGQFQINNFDDSPLTILIALYYLPKALTKITQEIDDWLYFDLNKILDRYSFSRKIAIIGETSKGIKSLLSFCQESQQYKFFHAFGKFRNAIKTKHFSFTVSQPNINTVKELKDFIDKLPSIRRQIGKLKVLYEFIVINTFRLTIINYTSIRKALEAMRVIELSSQDILSGSIKTIENIDKQNKTPISNKDNKFKEAKSLIDTIIYIQNKAEIPRASDIDLLNEYETAYNMLTNDETKVVSAADIQIIKGFKIQKMNKKPSQGLLEVIKVIKKIQTLTKQEQIKEKLDEYRILYEDIQNNDSDFLVLPEPNEESIKLYKTTIMNMELEEFRIHSQKYFKETPRLESFLFQYSKATDGIHKAKLEMAIAHSLGLIGEDIRYILEIDENSDFLSTFLTPQIPQEINHARHIRNKQVFHGIFDYNFDDVLNAANDEAVGWAQDISAVFVVENFGRVIELHKSYFSSSIVAIADNDKEIMISIYYKLMDAFSRIHQHEKAKNYANKLLNLIRDDSNFIVQKIMAYITKASTLHFTNRNLGAEDVLKEALSFAEAHNTYQGIDKYKSIIYTNLATIMSYKGNIEAVIKYYDESAATSPKGDILRIYPLAQKATLLHQNDRSKTLEAIQIIEELQNEQISIGISRNNIFEIFQLQRLIGVIYADHGNKDIALLWHQKSKALFYENIGLFKAQLGQRHKMIESIIHLDSASLLYDSGHYRKAIIEYEESYPIFLESNSNQDIARIHLYVAHCYKYLSQSCDISEKYKLSKLAIRNFEQSISILNNQESSASLELAHAYAGLSEVKLRSRRKDESTELTKKASEIFKSYDNEGKSYNNIHRSNIEIILQSQDSRRVTKAMFSSSSRFETLLEITINARKSLSRKVNKEDRIKEIKFALEASPENNRAKYNLMMEQMNLYCQLKKTKNAIAQLKQVNELLKTNPEFGEKDFIQRANNILQLIGISSIKHILKEDIYNYNKDTKIQNNAHLKNFEKHVLQSTNTKDTLNILAKKLASIHKDVSISIIRGAFVYSDEEKVTQMSWSHIIVLFSETNHRLNHKDNILTLIKMLNNNKIQPNTIICLERKQYGHNLGIPDVILLAKVLNLRNTEKEMLSLKHLQSLPIYYDALLYNIAKVKGVQVIGIEGKGLAHSKESPYYHQAREEYMTKQLLDIAKSGKNAIFLVGAAHINNLVKLLSEQGFYLDNSDNILTEENLVTLKFGHYIGIESSSLSKLVEVAPVGKSTILLENSLVSTNKILTIGNGQSANTIYTNCENVAHISPTSLAILQACFNGVLSNFDLIWQFKKFFYHQEVSQFNAILKNNGITKSSDILRSYPDFKKSVLLKLHPDKGGNPQDFIFVKDLQERFSADLNIEKILEDEIKSIQSIAHKATFGFKILDSVVDIVRLIHEPTIDNAKKIVLDSTYIYSMYYGVNRYSSIISAVDITYKAYQGEIGQAITQGLMTVSYMTVVPYAIGFTGIPYIGFVYSATMTIYIGYNTAINVYSFYLEYNSEDSAIKSAAAYKNLCQLLSSSTLQLIYDFEFISKDYATKLNNINHEKEKTHFKQQSEKKGEFGKKLYDYIHAPRIEEKYSLLNKIIQGALTTEELEALQSKHLQLTIADQSYDHCMEIKDVQETENQDHYYCYNEEQQILDHIVIVGNSYVEKISSL